MVKTEYVVDLLLPSGRRAGLGFAVAKNVVTTPYYVLADALMKDTGDVLPSGGRVHLSFPFLSKQGVFVCDCLISVGNVAPSTQMALIEITQPDLSDVLTIPPMITVRDFDEYFDRRIRVFGYTSGESALYVAGRVVGRLPDNLVQVDTDGELGYGFAGAPVWDMDRHAVLGVLYTVLDHNTGHVVPAFALSEAWPLSVMPNKGGHVVDKYAGKPPVIFISYAREDEDVADRIFIKLCEYGYAPWMDKKRLLPGADWDRAIREAIKTAQFCLLILSNASIYKRGYVAREFKLAYKIVEEVPWGGIYLLPVRVDDCTPPSEFQAYQWLDLKDDLELTQVRKAIEFELARLAGNAG